MADATNHPSASGKRTSDQSCEVCIIGAGMAGLSVAYTLSREGVNVIVLDRGILGAGQTERTTAHLTSVIDDRLFEIERIHGEAEAKLVHESHEKAIDFIEQACEREDISCAFQRVPDYLFVPHNESVDVLTKELDVYHRIGRRDVKRLLDPPVPSIGENRCLEFPDQAQFHPLQYLEGLAKAIKKNKGKILYGQHVSEMQGGEKAFVSTDQGFKITCKHIVIATNAPIHDNALIYSRQAPYRTYAIGLSMPHGSIPVGLYWDTHDPYHYVRLLHGDDHGAQGKRLRNHDVLIVGGEDHKTGQADDGEDRWKKLEQWARKFAPDAGEVLFQWSGQVLETFDGLGLIGRKPGGESNEYIATGDSGMGMTHGTIAGMLIADLILGRKNAWEELYDPSRIPVKALGEFAKENVNVAGEIADWVTGWHQVSSASEVKSGEGAVINDGIRRIALYRDERGKEHRCSAVCPHKGCIVHWNGTEKSWDCPCHGSRYDRFGELIQGPAMRGLGIGE